MTMQSLELWHQKIVHRTLLFSIINKIGKLVLIECSSFPSSAFLGILEHVDDYMNCTLTYSVALSFQETAFLDLNDSFQMIEFYEDKKKNFLVDEISIVTARNIRSIVVIDEKFCD